MPCCQLLPMSQRKRNVICFSFFLFSFNQMASAGSQCCCALSHHRISFTLWCINYKYSANCRVFIAPGEGHHLQLE